MGGGGGGLCLTFCDRQTTLFGTLLYDTFCIENCVTFGGGEGGLKHNITMTLLISKIVWRCPLMGLETGLLPMRASERSNVIGLVSVYISESAVAVSMKDYQV